MPREAFVVTNPKWELFSKVSEAFKNAPAPAVLVIRGHNKEKRKPGSHVIAHKTKSDSPEAAAADVYKSMRVAGKSQDEIEKAMSAAIAGFKKAAKLVVAAFLIGFCTMTVQASDISGNLPTLMLDAASTNAGPGQGILGWRLNDVAVTQISVTTTNVAHATTRSNVIVRLETSLNGNEWVAAGTLAVAPGATASVYTTSLATLTNTTGGKWLRVSTVENVNTNRIWLNHVTFEIP